MTCPRSPHPYWQNKNLAPEHSPLALTITQQTSKPDSENNVDCLVGLMGSMAHL